MSTHWLYRIKEARDEEKRRQAYFKEHFTAWAEAFWEHLCATVQSDFEMMKKLFPDLLSQETQFNRESRSLRIGYVDQLPHYHLCLTVNIPEQTLTLNQIKTVPHARPVSLLEAGPDTVFTLSFNEEEQRVEIALNEETFSPEEFSQKCLQPIFDLHPIEIAKIRGGHGKRGPSVRSF